MTRRDFLLPLAAGAASVAVVGRIAAQAGAHESDSERLARVERMVTRLYQKAGADADLNHMIPDSVLGDGALGDEMVADCAEAKKNLVRFCERTYQDAIEYRERELRLKTSWSHR